MKILICFLLSLVFVGCSSLNKKTLDSFTDPEFLNSQMKKGIEEVRKLQAKVDMANDDSDLWWNNIKIKTDELVEKLKVLTIGINAALLQAKIEEAQAEQE